MEWMINQVRGLCKFLNIIAGCALTLMMLITVTDVVLRALRMPIVGTYELVAFGGGIVIGFAVPLTSMMKIQVYVDVVTSKLPKAARMGLNVITRLMGVGLFSLAGWNLVKMGMDMIRTGEVSLTLQLPFYPIAFGIGLAFFIQCLVLVAQIFQVFGGTYD
jgi:TRAP-type C4-dicarboxylate transport system permease small subunit